MKVKVFFEYRHSDLEFAINDWLANHPGTKVDHVTQSSSQHGHCVTMWYTNG